MYSGYLYDKDTIKSTFITTFGVDISCIVDLLNINNIPILWVIPEADTVVIQQGYGERAEFKITQGFPDVTVRMNTLVLNK